MQLRLKNINKIEEATINLNGLTIVAGVNDTGKSTIGKVLFALIKAMNKVATHTEESKLKKYKTQALNLYMLLRRTERQLSDTIIGNLFPATSKDFVEEITGIGGESILESSVYMIEGLEINP